MRTDELDFHLPPELIAQVPPPRREESRLLHYRRHDRSVAHRTFSDLPAILRPGDLLVFNDTRVLPARFTLRKTTGGRIEGLFLSEIAPGRWHVMLRGLERYGRKPLHFELAPEITANVVVPEPTVATPEDGDDSLPPSVLRGRAWEGASGYSSGSTKPPPYPPPEYRGRGNAARSERSPEITPTPASPGEYELAVHTTEPAAAILARVGRMPLPPYIKRDKSRDERDDLDRGRYQTVFARAPGAVAAPTAALHFSRELLSSLDAAGIARTFVTLHVGPGTFKPVTADTLEGHVMHVEPYAIGPDAAAALNQAKEAGRRIIAVGTTAARVLESQPAGEPFAARSASTGIFIHPPYEWKHVDGLITNFHLPRSTLIALVAAMTGLEEQRRLYRMAMELGYRFFSYGDGMLIE